MVGHRLSAPAWMAIAVVCIARAAWAFPLEPQAGRLHVLTVETPRVAGADVDALRIHSLGSDWSEATSPEHSGLRIRWRQSRPAGGTGTIRDALLQQADLLKGRVQPDDIVFFYYSGHGATDQLGRHLLQLDDESVLFREELVDRLRKLGARLTWVITDCCSVSIKLPPVISSVPTIRPELKQLRENLIQLFRADGVFDLNACSTGEIAWGTNAGGIFTTALIHVLRNDRLTDEQQFVKLVVAKTASSFHSFRKEQLADAAARTKFSAEELASLEEQKTQRPFRAAYASAGEMARPSDPVDPQSPLAPSTGAVSRVDRVHLFCVVGSSAGAKANAERMQDLLADWVQAAGANRRGEMIVWHVEKQDRGQLGLRGKLLERLDELRPQIKPNDVVLFYYSGHGGTDARNRSLLQLDDGTTLVRDDVLDELRGFGARLTIFLTDCTATYFERKDKLLAEPVAREGLLQTNLGRLLRAHGVVHLASSWPGQSSWGTESGGLFTVALARVLRDEEIRDWDHLAKQVAERTGRDFEALRAACVAGKTSATIEERGRIERQVAQAPYRYPQSPVWYELVAAAGETSEPQARSVLKLTAPENAKPGKEPVTVLKPALEPPSREKLVIRQGVRVARVEAESTATNLRRGEQEAALAVGDRILEINGQATPTIEDFFRVLSAIPLRSEISMAIHSAASGEEWTLRGKIDRGARSRIGVTVAED